MLDFIRLSKIAHYLFGDEWLELGLSDKFCILKLIEN